MGELIVESLMFNESLMFRVYCLEFNVECFLERETLTWKLSTLMFRVYCLEFNVGCFLERETLT